MANKLGSIPQKLTLFARPEEAVTWRWADVEGGEMSHEVRPVYISDSANKKTCETGLAWANQPGGYWEAGKDTPYGKYVRIKPAPEVFADIPNVEISNLRIITLEIRDKGGRAYKCMADIGPVKNAYFDMREDVLLDCMFQQGIVPGGICIGPFIFARVDTQMKPIRVDSLLFEKMVEATAFNKLKALSVKDYKIGDVFEDKGGNQFIFIGTGFTRTVEIFKSYAYFPYYNPDGLILKEGEVLIPIVGTYPGRSEGYRAGGMSESEPCYIFLEKFYYDRKKEYIKPEYKYGLKVVKKPSFREKVGKVSVSQEIIDWPFIKRDLKRPSYPNEDNLSKTQGYTHPFYTTIPLKSK